MMQNKGQLLTTEFLFGTTIFCLLLILVLISFSDTSNLIDSKTNSKKDFDFAFTASDFLVLTPGNPNNWQALDLNNVHHIGLIDSDNEINENKLLKFIDLNSQYSLVKEKLGLSQYELYVSFTNNQNANILYEFGIQPTNTSTITAITRYATLNSNIIKINLKVWK